MLLLRDIVRPRYRRDFDSHHSWVRLREGAFDKIQQVLDFVERVKKHTAKMEADSLDLHRMQFILEGRLSGYANDPDQNIFDLCREDITNSYEEIKTRIIERRSALFHKKIGEVWRESLDNFSVSELGSVIASNEDKVLGQFLTIKNTIYIDSPMAIAHPYYGGYATLERLDPYDHWIDLEHYLKKENPNLREGDMGNLAEIFSSKEVLDGEVSMRQDTEEFYYHRKDGKRFRILDTATGIKSIATLQILYRNGCLMTKPY